VVLGRWSRFVIFWPPDESVTLLDAIGQSLPRLRTLTATGAQL
jgi:hypothetical protein